MPTPWRVRFLVGLGVSVVVWVLGGLGALARLDDLGFVRASPAR